MGQISPHRRPHYPPTERMAILELRAARGWSLQQTADTFRLTAPTVASWMKRVDEEGPDALVQLRAVRGRRVREPARPAPSIGCKTLPGRYVHQEGVTCVVEAKTVRDS